MPNVAVVIPAGGRGRRMGGTLPKQFLRVGGMTVLERTIGAFHSVREVGEIVVVVPAAFVLRTMTMVRRRRFVKVTGVVKGGKQRQDSVRNGLRACRGKTDLVLIHDAVRPLIEPALIRTVIHETEHYGAAVVGTRVKDTIKIESNDRQGFASVTPPRERLWAVQTPQGFRFGLIWRAHEEARSAGFHGTDESSLVERLGVPVRIVPGDETNIKITTPADRKLAELLLKGGL